MLDVETGHIVKICGLRTVAAARTAALAGADALGFILAESRRQVAPTFVREVRETVLTGIERPPALVGVTVNATGDQIRSFVEESGIDVVQLSGDESPDLLAHIDVPVVKTIHVSADMTLDDLDRLADPWLDHPKPAVAIHIDAKVAGAYGGTGVRSDWSLAAHLASRYPALLAGGLNPGNVFEGIQAVAPRGVDVSSGVEIAGEKDLALIEAFIAHARQGFAPVDEDETGY
jgi:phosphoribosylanthranilate isomerase